jgi:hypothetical protein
MSGEDVHKAYDKAHGLQVLVYVVTREDGSGSHLLSNQQTFAKLSGRRYTFDVQPSTNI